MAELFRPNVARLRVKVDLLKCLPHKVWVECGSIEGFWQDVVYEKIPDYMGMI